MLLLSTASHRTKWDPKVAAKDAKLKKTFIENPSCDQVNRHEPLKNLTQL